MNCLPLIEAKRDGSSLSEEQIYSLVAAYCSGEVPDYQIAALLMAIYFKGLNDAETRALTLAMRDSGVVLKFPDDPRPVVDKHSSGGVGDKVSLALAPLLACLGLRVPKISGRSLGVTGGTLDKLESIPGFTTALEPERVVQQVQTVGCAICAQTPAMVPADKLIYALRDVTGTVPSIPLITSSILSKKLAEGLQALVLDVKFGEAAFMTTLEDAERLAQSMISLGQSCGLKVRVLLTNMNRPLGRAVGNWLEVREAVACLENHGPADLTDLVLHGAAELLLQVGLSTSFEQAHSKAQDMLRSGAPLQKWNEMLEAQGANMRAYRIKLTEECWASYVLELEGTRSGYVQECRARIVGEVVRDLGGGRLTKNAALNHDAGIDHLAKPGDKISPGCILARIHAEDAAAAHRAAEQLKNAFTFSDSPPTIAPLIVKTM